MEESNVALFGCGTVGMGVVKLLLARDAAHTMRIGRRINLRYVVDKRVQEVAAALDLPESVKLTADIDEALQDDSIDIVVELFGGIDAPLTVAKRALEAGKDVVTANKALLATHGSELFRLARGRNRCIAFEASVGGGIPVIQAIRDGLIGSHIRSVHGIVNGTCNYILTRMMEAGMGYEQALAEAQKKGYAEADPRLDVEGGDSAHKLCVLARLAFGSDVKLEDVHCEGIVGIELEDLRYAHVLGYTVKLLAIGIRAEDRIDVRVHPTLLHHWHPIAAVGGVLNAICIAGDRVGEVVLTGQGAGRWPTAGAVIADICQVALGTCRTSFAELSQFGDVPVARLRPFEEVHTRYYIRLSCLDRPGVLAQVAGILGGEKISIASCRQQDVAARGDKHVPVVFMTHRAREGAVRTALGQINRLDCIDGAETRMIRVEDI